MTQQLLQEPKEALKPQRKWRRWAPGRARTVRPAHSRLADPLMRLREEEAPAPSQRRAPLANWRRHVRMLLKYGTLSKFVNLLRAGIHYLRGSTRIPTMPAFLKVEISRACNVHCKYCFAEKAQAFYPLDDYKRLVDKLKDYVFLVSLYEIGEPLLNGKVLEYIRYAHERKLGTVISTSLSLRKPDEFWRQLVTSGLDRIIVSVDGISEEVYSQYRTHGDFDLVMSNLRKLLHYKAQCKSNIIVEWQMIDLPWNKAQQEAARQMAMDMGCDSFRIIPEAVMPRQRYAQEKVPRKRNCLLPYIVFITDAFKRIRPCYKMYTEDMTIGSLKTQSFEEIWNGEEMGRIRDKEQIRARCVCSTCRE